MAIEEGKPFKTTHMIQIIKIFKTPAGVMLYQHDEDEVAVQVSLVKNNICVVFPYLLAQPVLYRDGQNYLILETHKTFL